MTRTRSVSEGNLLALRGFSRPHLQRPAHSSGLAAFVAAMQQGITDQQVVADILGSPEYFG